MSSNVYYKLFYISSNLIRLLYSNKYLRNITEGPTRKWSGLPFMRLSKAGFPGGNMPDVSAKVVRFTGSSSFSFAQFGPAMTRNMGSKSTACLHIGWIRYLTRGWK